MKQLMMMSALGLMTLVMEKAQAFLDSSPLVNRRSPRCFRLEESEYSRRLGVKRVPTIECAPDRDDDDPTFLKERGDAGPATRQGWIQAAAAVATQAGVAIVASPEWVSAENAPNGLPPSGYFVQHAVFKVGNMDDEVNFFTKGLGMRVVGQEEVNGARSVFVSYGEESLKVKDGGFFSLELVYDAKGPPSYPSGGPFQYLGLSLPSTPATVAYNVDAAGGTIVPHWFGTKDFVEATSPSGTTVRVKEGKRRDPISVLAFSTQFPDRSKTYFKDVLGMKEQDQGLGGTFEKLAILTKDTMVMADKMSGSGGAGKGFGGDVLFAGEVPGIGTKVANTIDFEGRGVVFVDYDDFEGEMDQGPQ